MSMTDVTVSASNIRASKVNGTAVYGITGERIGHVEDVVIGKIDGQVKYAILSFGGFLGMGEDHHPLPWSILSYDVDKGGYVVDITREQLEGAPRFSATAEPDWSSEQYGRGVYKYWGMPYI